MYFWFGSIKKMSLIPFSQLSCNFAHFLRMEQIWKYFWRLGHLYLHNCIYNKSRLSMLSTIINLICQSLFSCLLLFWGSHDLSQSHYISALLRNSRKVVPTYVLYVKVKNIDFSRKDVNKKFYFRIKKMYWSGQVCWTWQVCTIVGKKEKRVATLKSNDSFFVS